MEGGGSMAEGSGINATALLLEKVQAMIDGAVSFFDFLGIIPSVEEDLSRLRLSFNETVAAESTFVQEYCQASIVTVHRCFDEITRIIRELESASRSADKTQLQSVAKRTAELQNDLNLAFLNFQQNALIARGPSPHSGINLIHNCLQRLIAGDDCRDELRLYFERELRLADQALLFLQTSDDGLPTQGMTDFYTSYIGLLQTLAVPEGLNEIDKVQQVLNELQNLGEYYRRIDMKYQVEAFWHGPTSLPPVNLVLNAGYYYTEGWGEEHVFRYFLQELRKLHDSARRKFDFHSGRVMEENEKAQRELLGRALDAMAESISGFDQFLSTADNAMFTQYANLLYAAATDYMQASTTLMEMEEMQKKIMCLSCGFLNVAGEVSCRNCHALLPQVEDSRHSSMAMLADEGLVHNEVNEEPVLTLNVKNLLDAADGLAAGTTSAAEFEGVLSHMEKRLRSASSFSQDAPKLTAQIIEKMGDEKAREYQRILQQASLHYREGIEAFARGMTQMRDYGTAPTSEKLDAAKGNILDGTRKLQKAQALLPKEYIRDIQGQ
jgi:hypothetical protein